jgi:outer membrane protein OmpA-like peptidoglycan-associated protein
MKAEANKILKMKKIFFLIVFTLQFSLTCFSQDSLHRYTDIELMKLVKYIKGLEGRTASYSASHPDDVFVVNVAKSVEEKAILTDLIKDSLHRYNDSQIIKLAGYIKHLEKLDSLNTYTIAMVEETKKRVADSIAKTQVVVLEEQKEISEYEKLIFFNFDSSVLKEESYKPLDEAVKILKNHSNLVFTIEGHTDSIGPVAYNLNLSKERARTVMNYFISKGIPADRISSTGYGEAKPVATNETAEGQAKNRRVEIRAKKK